MKIRLIALFLLPAIALTACVPAFPQTASGKTEHGQISGAGTAVPAQDLSGFDPGTVNGSIYENETLGISCCFPAGWYIYSESDLADKNAEVSQIYDQTALSNAIESGQEVVIFCASRTASTASVTIEASVNPLPGLTEKEFVARAAPQIEEQFEQIGYIQDVVRSTVEADFCGQTHTVLLLSLKTNVYQSFEAMVFLPRGDLVYSIIVSSIQEADLAEVLNLFEAIE